MPFGPGLAGAHHRHVEVARPAAGDERLRAVEHVIVAVAPRARRQRRRVRAAARLGQAIAGEMLHRHQLGQEPRALLGIAKAVDHPRRHVVDRQIGGGRGAGRRQLLEDQRRVEPGEAAAAELVLDVDAGKAERRRRAQRRDRKLLALVPARRVRQPLGAGEFAAPSPETPAARRRDRNPCAEIRSLSDCAQSSCPQMRIPPALKQHLVCVPVLALPSVVFRGERDGCHYRLADAGRRARRRRRGRVVAARPRAFGRARRRRGHRRAAPARPRARDRRAHRHARRDRRQDAGARRRGAKGQPGIVFDPGRAGLRQAPRRRCGQPSNSGSGTSPRCSPRSPRAWRNTRPGWARSKRPAPPPMAGCRRR